jgi:SAM-dependent methyltransferase
VRTPAERLQHDFYSATAEQYHREFVHAGDEHTTALRLISALIAGTGRGVRHFLDRHPGVEVRGVEPVRAMIDVAESANAIPAGRIVEASGDRLPFDDASFDVVCESGMLHHVPDPNLIVQEMMRVARYAVFLSDENRFGRGGATAGAIKYALYRLGLWPLVWRMRTRGRGYILTAGDGGVAYSYSVYESLAPLGAWADRVFLVPTVPARTGWFHPLFGASHLLVCALRD